MSGVNYAREEEFVYPHGFSFTQNSVTHTRKISGLLLDSQSTYTVYCDRVLMSNISPSIAPLSLVSTGGNKELFRIRGWFDESGIANIISLMELTKACNMKMDTDSNFRGRLGMERKSCLHLMRMVLEVYILLISCIKKA